MRKALITGVTGQDGAYLADLLLKKGYKVYATFRRASTPNFWRLQYLDIHNKINLIPADLTDMTSLIEAIKTSDPDEIYNMAASSYVADSFECPLANIDITGNAVFRLLESIRIVNKGIKFYQASSSEMYGNFGPGVTEHSKMEPISPYGVAKLAGHHAVQIYREAYKIYAVSGILFNHESELRGLDFVTRKITNQVAKISLGLAEDLWLGNLEAARDWGYAPEYMNAVHSMMNMDEPSDFVIATEESHTVFVFAAKACDHANVDRSVIKFDKTLLRPTDIDHLLGNSHKARHELKWNPTIYCDELVKIMVDEDIKRWQAHLDGHIFPWDAYLYPSELNIMRRCTKS